MVKRINEEVKIWEDRVYFGSLDFKEENKEPKSPYYQIIKRTSDAIMDDKFRVIACEAESQCYKVARLMLEKFGYTNQDFTFENGFNLEVYLGDVNEGNWALQRKVQEYVKLNRESFYRKVVIIPLLDININSVIAVYLANKLEEAGAIGLLFSYEGNYNDNLMNSLVLGYYNKIVQFPKTSVVVADKKLEDDGL